MARSSARVCEPLPETVVTSGDLELSMESNPSRHLWERLGFENLGRIPEAVQGEGALLYRRALRDGAT